METLETASKPQRLLRYVVFFLLGAAAASLLNGFLNWRSQHLLKQPSTQVAQNSAVTQPWGRIEAMEIPLSNPDGAFPDQEQRLAPARWFFDAFNESRLTRFLSSCDLRPTEQRMLLDKRDWEFLPDGIVISPSEQLLWSLTPQSREQIYSVLAKNPKNFPQCFPFRFPLAGIEQRFKGSDLSAADLEKIWRLSYTNDGYLCFTDLQAIKAVYKPAEFNDLVETLYQMPTYVLRLRVTPDSNVDALVKYWGKGGRERLIAPLLNSMSKVPGGVAFNISYFLPAFARLHLYTYPYTWQNRVENKSDCFFTSMNFFNTTPDTNFFDRAYTASVLKSDYHSVERNPTFGDIVALSNGANQIFHTCVYLAEDFVFTKNGADPEQPWVIMKLPDMLTLYYSTDRSGHISFLRRTEGS